MNSGKTFSLNWKIQKSNKWEACYSIIKRKSRDLPGGLVVKTPPCNAGDEGSTPGWGTKTPCAIGQLSLCAIAKSLPTYHNQDPMQQ